MALRIVAPVMNASILTTSHRAYLLICLAFFGASAVLGPFVGWVGPVGADVWYAQAILMTAMIVGAVVLRERFRAERRGLPMAAAYADAWRAARRGLLTDERFSAYVVVVATMPLYVACYTGWKMWLNATLPFTWDATFATWDRVLHGGRQPWEWVAFAPTRMLGFLYAHGWTLVVHAVTAWQAIAPPSPRRERFLVASLLAWPLAGITLAGLFMSAGPAFHHAVTGDQAAFAGMTGYLRASGQMWAQDYLWTAYETRSAGVAAGISAMPSMHIVMATLVALVVQRRALGLAFLAVMLVACVHLGWHYAVDLYVGVLIGLALWWLAGRLTR